MSTSFRSFHVSAFHRDSGFFDEAEVNITTFWSWFTHDCKDRPAIGATFCTWRESKEEEKELIKKSPALPCASYKQSSSQASGVTSTRVERGGWTDRREKGRNGGGTVIFGEPRGAACAGQSMQWRHHHRQPDQSRIRSIQTRQPRGLQVETRRVPSDFGPTAVQPRSLRGANSSHRMRSALHIVRVAFDERFFPENCRVCQRDNAPWDR